MMEQGTKIRKGDIVRRTVSSGIPVGQYCTVGFVKNGWAYLIPISSQKSTIALSVLKSNVYKPKMMRVVIPKFVFDRIRTNVQHAIIHDATPLWEKMLENDIEIVQLTSAIYPENKLLFRVDGVCRVFYKNTPQVRLLLGEPIP